MPYWSGWYLRQIFFPIIFSWYQRLIRTWSRMYLELLTGSRLVTGCLLISWKLSFYWFAAYNSTIKRAAASFGGCKFIFSPRGCMDRSSKGGQQKVFGQKFRLDQKTKRQLPPSLEHPDRLGLVRPRRFWLSQSRQSVILGLYHVMAPNHHGNVFASESESDEVKGLKSINLSVQFAQRERLIIRSRGDSQQLMCDLFFSLVQTKYTLR